MASPETKNESRGGNLSRDETADISGDETAGRWVDMTSPETKNESQGGTYLGTRQQISRVTRQQDAGLT
jgi:hypothetical protein